MHRRVLILDDDAALLDVLREELGRRQYDVVAHESAAAALHALAEGDFGAVVCDIHLGPTNGVDVCREIVGLREHTPVIVMTAFASIEAAVSSIRAGAYDFVTKPFAIDDLVLTLERALKARELREEVKRLRRAVSTLDPIDEMVGESATMKKMYEIVLRVAESDATVLVTGESGTGKELVAKTVHSRSARARGPFVAINCAAMPEPLLESELFGHARGAFTDARTAREGLFLKAAGGTLFLDEVGEMPMGMQAKLLRALQERTVRAVGSEVETAFDARIVAATNRDLERATHEGTFREDLFYRINVVQIHVPALRARENDVLLLAHEFLRRKGVACSKPAVSGFTSAAVDRLLSYPWPGNVRELQNCVERAVALAELDRIGVADLPERVAQFKSSRISVGADASTILPMDEVERRYVSRVLDALGGNKASAARSLGMDRRTLYRKLERWGSNRPPSRTSEWPEEPSTDIVG